MKTYWWIVIAVVVILLIVGFWQRQAILQIPANIKERKRKKEYDQHLLTLKDGDACTNYVCSQCGQANFMGVMKNGVCVPKAIVEL